MQIDAFQPASGGSTLCAVTASDQFFAVPGNGEVLRLTNTSANIVYVEVDGTTLSTVANSFPVLPNSAVNVKRYPQYPGSGAVGIRAIAGVAGPSNLIVSVGNYGT
jgi:hypothetical protein